MSSLALVTPPAAVAVPTGPVSPIAWSIIRTMISTIVVRSAVVVSRPAAVGSTIIATVVRWSVIRWAKVVEQKRERQRDTKAYTLRVARELGAQEQDGQQKNEQLFHRGSPWGLGEPATRRSAMKKLLILLL